MIPPTVISIKPATTTVAELKVIRGLIDSLIADKLHPITTSDLYSARIHIQRTVEHQEGLAK